METAPSSRDSSLVPCPGVPLPSNFSTLCILSRIEIASRISLGELLIIHSPLVYRVPRQWLKLHPGGDKSLLHYIGRDAGCEIEAYHSGKTVKERMSRWIIGKVEIDDETQGWRDMIPPIQLGMYPIPVPKIIVSEPTTTTTSSTITSSSGSSSILTPELIDPPLLETETELPLNPVYQAHLRRSHRRLHEKIHELSLDTRPRFLSGYFPSLLIYTSLLVLSIYTYLVADSHLGYTFAACCLGMFWHQITFVAHDTGHSELSGNWWIDRLWGVFIADFMGGLSIGWWCDNHNIHHLVTNSPEHDPDIQHLPFFAISTKFFQNLKSSYYDRVMKLDQFARYVLPYQHKLYYIVMCFARFNLFALSYSFLLTNWPHSKSPLFKLRLLEFIGIGSFWYWFTKVLIAIPNKSDRCLYLLISFAVTSPLHVQIVLSHFSQPISILPPTTTPSSCLPLPIRSLELLESHPHRQLRTTMDISCPNYLDFLHGGLNFQTPHHLFPRIPRFQFRRVALEVEKWVEQENSQISFDENLKRKVWRGKVVLGENEGLVYKKMSFVEGNKSVLGVLKNVADQARLLCKVAEKEAKGELSHH